jgi:hypothetical protein
MPEEIAPAVEQQDGAAPALVADADAREQRAVDVDHDAAAPAALAVEDRRGEPDGRLMRHLDLAALAVEVEPRDVNLILR